MPQAGRLYIMEISVCEQYILLQPRVCGHRFLSSFPEGDPRLEAIGKAFTYPHRRRTVLVDIGN